MNYEMYLLYLGGCNNSLDTMNYELCNSLKMVNYKIYKSLCVVNFKIVVIGLL